MEVTGKIKVIGNTINVTETFSKRELVVSTDEQYPQHILIEFNKDKCSLLDKFKVGEVVTVGINLQGREWVNPQGETKYFNSVKGWKIFKANESETVNQVVGQVFETVDALNEMEHDDLPF
jgi:hypothetical protein